MMPKNFALMSVENLVMLARISGALVIGALIGMERTLRGRPAGSARMRWCASPPPC